jgi:hypothetical protein
MPWIACLFCALPLALAAWFWIQERRRLKQPSPANTAKSLRGALGSCQACAGSLSGHRLHELFQCIEATELRQAEIDQQVKDRDWEVFKGQNSYDPERDSFAYWFVECPATKAGGLYRVWSFAAFDSPGDRRDPAGTLDAGETARLLAVLGNKEPQIL